MSAGFQLSVELSRIVAPLTNALGRTASLALYHAIKQSGSDLITEIQLASLIGRHRIEPLLAAQFRHAVVPSSHVPLSKVVDSIFLVSGAGPSVQEALREGNPALFSMIVQVSLLSYSSNEETLALMLANVSQNLLEVAKYSLEHALDYTSLVGTVQACRSQTVAFVWAQRFQAVELILDSLFEKRPGVESHRRWSREVPQTVLQALIMWLPMLQSLPESRFLHIHCRDGLTTIIVWCHYVLGLTIKFGDDPHSILFGSGDQVIVLTVAAPDAAETASLYDTADPNEPLFRLRRTEEEDLPYNDRFFEAKDFGRRLLMRKGAMGDHEVDALAMGVVRRVIKSATKRATVSAGASEKQLEFLYTRVLAAADVLFSVSATLDNYRTTFSGFFMFLKSSLSTSSGTFVPHFLESLESFNAWSRESYTGHLDRLLLDFATIADPTSCESLSMNLSAAVTYHHLRDSIERPESLVGPFRRLTQLIYSKEPPTHIRDSASLVCERGWSIYLPFIDAENPEEAEPSVIFAQPGVPTRGSIQRKLIIDGPEDLELWPSLFVSESRVRASSIDGLATIKRKKVVIANNAGAFSVTQVFQRPMTVSQHQYDFRGGFRWWHTINNLIAHVLPCKCHRRQGDARSQMKELCKAVDLAEQLSQVRLEVLWRLPEDKDEGEIILTGLQGIDLAPSLYIFSLMANPIGQRLMLEALQPRPSGPFVVVRSCSLLCAHTWQSILQSLDRDSDTDISLRYVVLC